MAWLRWRKVKRTGRTHAYLAWKDEEGRERTKPLHTTDPDVASALLREHQRATGQVPSAVLATTAKEALDDYLAELAVRLKPRSVLDYRERLGRLVGAWSDRPMHLWTRAAFVKYVSKRGARGGETLTGQCKRWIRWAKSCDVPMPDFVGDFRPAKYSAPEKDAMSAEQEAALVSAAAGHRYLELPIYLALYAGLSLADLRALAWAEVDLAAGLIQRDRSKTGQGLRIPIVGRLAEALQRARAISGPVCRQLPKSDRSLLKALHLLCDEAGVPRAGWHRFRHTFGTRLSSNRAPYAALQRLMGHKPGSSVTGRYVHPDEDELRNAMDRAFGG